MFDKFLAAFIVGFLIVPALADATPPDNAGGRYSFNKIADGLLRLDLQTGEVSVCRQHSVGWACQAVPEDRAVLENEIARLRSENATLKKDLLSRGLPLPSGTLPEPPMLREGVPPPRLGAHSDLDRMMALAGRVWHRLVEALARAERKMLDNG